jgi:hypothetical protein
VAPPKVELPWPRVDVDQGVGVAGSLVAPPAFEHELSHTEERAMGSPAPPLGSRSVGHLC